MIIVGTFLQVHNDTNRRLFSEIFSIKVANTLTDKQTDRQTEVCSSDSYEDSCESNAPSELFRVRFILTFIHKNGSIYAYIYFLPGLRVNCEVVYTRETQKLRVSTCSEYRKRVINHYYCQM